MAAKKMNIEEMKQILDEHEIDHSEAKLREDYLELMEQVETEEDVNDKPEGLLGKVQAAKKIERTVTKKVEDKYAYLEGRDYGMLDVAEREIIRQRSKVYEDKEGGISVKVTERLITQWQIVKLADRSYSKLLKGEHYVLSEEDYNLLSNTVIKVKTEATKNKCCGQAVYEKIKLLEVLNG